MACTIVSGLVLSPYLIRKLGAEGYGVWVLVFGLIENYWLFDLGLRSATVKYSAHYRALNEPDKINEVINTGVVYFSFVALALVAGTFVLSRYIDRLFQVSSGYRPDFQFLVALIGASWALGMIFNVFTATLEGFQHFDISSRIWIAGIAIRVFGTAILLYLGYRLVALGILVVAAQVFGYALSVLSVRRVFPAQRFSPKLANFRMLKQLVGYGVHTLTGTVAQQLLSQSAPLLIGHFRPAAQVGYYNVPVRLLQYTGDGVDRVALVTSSNTAELQAKNEHDAISQLGIYVNRYCLALFLPIAIFLLVYGTDVIRVWIRDPQYVAASAPLIQILLIGVTIAIAAQVNSSAILYGMAKHKRYARGLLAEGIALAGGLYFVVPRFGIFGAACMTSALMTLVRGIYTPWLVCRELNFSFARYMREIYLRPLATSVPVLACAWWMKRALIPGRSLVEVAAAAAIVGVFYWGAAFLTALAPEHRVMVFGWIMRKLWPPARLKTAA